MNEANPDRELQCVGKRCFVRHFYEFLKEPQTVDVVERISRKEHCTQKSCRSRAPHARRIFKVGRTRNARREISRSSRVPGSVHGQAARIADSVR